MGFLEWLQNSRVGLWISESDWGYPIVLNGHAVGMAIVVGVVLMFCVRVLGYNKSLPATVFEKLLVVAWLGFALNAATGVLLFLGKAQQFIVNPAFLIKIGLIVCGGVSVWLLTRMFDQNPAWAQENDMPSRAKIVAAFVIVFWLGAIVAGRLIGYTLGPPPPPSIT